ncbi:MAG: restriction endonuclease subunit S [Ruminococcus sp.]|nr:restriction endonuclease subunit S [Ruminococcus sp.]
MAKLGDICDVRDGTHDSPTYVNTGYPLVTSKNIVDGKLDLSVVNFISLEDYNKINERSKVDVGDIIMPMIGTIGNPYLVDVSTEFAIKNVALIKFNKREANNRYIYYFLQSENFRKYITKNNRGGTQKFLSLKDIRNIEIDIASYDEQLEIVETLDGIFALINLRKKQLSKLDELVKSRFIEMFGDPVENPLNWEIGLLKNITSKIGSGATPRGGKESYQSEGVTLIRSMNVHDGRFEYKDLAHITDKQAKQLENVIVEKNDVFINITGASVARSCIVPEYILPARVNQHVAIIRCISSIINPVFANNMFLNTSFKGRLLDIGESGGATRQAITKQQLEMLDVIIPPIELQNEFATFVEQTEKVKLEVKESLEKLVILKKSLMQEYFG